MKKWIPIILLALLVLLSGCLSTRLNSADAHNNFLPNDTDAGKMTIKGLRFHTDLQPALDAAKAQGKPVFVYARSEYCGWCKKFEAETLTNQSAARTLNENFILVSIDVDKQKNETRNFRVHGTPTEIFLDSNGTEIKRIPGYTDNQTFLDIINEIAK